MPDVSVLIHARDAAATLPRLLGSVAWSDDVVVMAMPGDDDTEGVAERLGARVVRIPAEPWSDAIRNRHLHEARHPWTLVLDSDEWLPDDAERLVADLLQRYGPTVDCFAIERVNLVEDLVMVAGDWAPDRQWRLFRTGALEYAVAHHQPPILRDGFQRRLVVDEPDALRIHHANYATLAALVQRGARYATTDDYAIRDWDPGEYARRIHGLLSWRTGDGGDGELGRATAIVMAWNQAMEQVLHWATLDPRPPLDGVLAVPIAPPSAPEEPPATGSLPPAGRPAARDVALQVDAATLRRAWRAHAAHRRLETVPFRHSTWASMPDLALERHGGAPSPIEDRLADRRVVLLARALRRSLRRRLRGGAGPYPLPPLEGVALSTSAVPRVSIVVPFKDQIEMTLQCLEEATVHAVGVDLEVILVDDGSEQDHRQVVDGIPGVAYVRLEPGLGFLHAANEGVKRARGDVIVLLNNDTLPRAGWLDALLAAFEDGPDVGIAGPVFLEPDGRIGEAGAGVRPDGRAVIHGHGLVERTPPFDVPRDVGYVSGACLAIRRGLWWELGGFDPRYAPAYYEDTDLCLAARQRGWRVRWTPDARVIHLGGQSYGRSSAAKDAVLEDSRRAFRAKWGRELDRLSSDTWHGPLLPRAPAATRGALVVVERHCVRADVDGGSVHLVQVLRALVRDRWDIAYLTLDRDVRSEAAESLRREGIRVVSDVGHAASALDRAPTAILVRRPDSLGTLVLELVQRWPDAALVYDTVDLHEDRLRMEAEARGDGDARVVRVVGAVERAGLAAADLVIAVSEEEAEVIAERAPGASVVVAPPSFPLTASVPPRTGRMGMLLLGAYRHPPNVDAARRLATRVLPLVREARAGEFATLAGTHPPMDLLILRERHGVAVPGYVADLDALHGAHVACVAPLEWGAGANGKLVAAMAAGLPVVTTPFGATGLAAVDGEHLLVADTDEALAAAYLRLVADDALWQRLSDGGRALVRERYEPDVAYADLRTWLAGRAAVGTPSA